MATSVAQRVREQYPSLSFLLNDPELGKLLTQAVDPNKGFSPQTFQAKLYQTSWWKRRSKTHREWAITRHTDPGEASQKRTLMQEGIAARARALGIRPARAELESIREMALRMGLAPDDFHITNALVKLWRKGGRVGPARGGAFQSNMVAIQQTANQEFLTGVTKKSAAQWSEWITTGQKTLEDFAATQQARAIKRFPHLAEALKAGQTLGDVVAPYQEIVAEELELGNPARVDVKSGPWRALLGIRDPKTRKMRMPTESDVIRMARSRPEYWKTSGGRQADAGMASALLQMFGKRGGAS